MAKSRRNLVIAAVGDSSVHSTWLSRTEERSYDVALIYYGDVQDRYRQQADQWVSAKGFKYPLLADYFDQHAAELDQYQNIWAPDDDVAASVQQINLLFTLCQRYALAIAQPGVVVGDVSYLSLRQREELLVRYTGFVEVMCPVFSQEALNIVRPTFRESLSGWGLDWAWTQLVDATQIAVVDGVGVHHTRPIQTGEAYQRFTEQGVEPGKELERLLHKYGSPTRRQRRKMKYGSGRFKAVNNSGQSITTGLSWWNRLWPAA